MVNLDKQNALRAAKRRAGLLLVLAASVFVGSLLGPANLWWVGLARAASEAALVGGLADWFAVSALFGPVRIAGLPLFGAHTAIIARNKDRIGDNLAQFVQDKFLGTPTLLALLRQHQPLQRMAQWLQDPAHADQVGTLAQRWLAGVLNWLEDRQIQQFLHTALKSALQPLDLSHTSGDVLDLLTKDGRHQALLERGIQQAQDWLNRPATRALFAAKVVDWLTSEHAKLEKLLPTEWIGTNSADAIAKAAHKLLDNVVQRKDHLLRQQFDAALRSQIEQLRNSPAYAAQGEKLKQALLSDPLLASYAQSLWASLRDWLRSDLASSQSTIKSKVASLGQWLGRTLEQDPALVAALNLHIEQAAESLAPDVAHFFARHIRDTVQRWDAHELSQMVELQIGPDLQSIRINGTVIGAVLGLLLYGLTWLPALLAR